MGFDSLHPSDSTDCIDPARDKFQKTWSYPIGRLFTIFSSKAMPLLQNRYRALNLTPPLKRRQRRHAIVRVTAQ